MTAASSSGSREERIAAYKTILRGYIDRRPSGTRLKIAEALGKHKSFVSQITNPSYSVPLPVKHVNAIFQICHFSAEERQSFLAAYTAAHPEQHGDLALQSKSGSSHVLHIPVPAFEDAETQKEVEETIRQFAARLIGIALKR
jgi:hypothetical protein